ncbi:MAG: hypothetical protein AABX01_07005 [Candidatus Micrarchaeota archaeon]
MERLFGVWYENRLIDAGVKTFLVLALSYLLIFTYNFFGGKPIMRPTDFPLEAVGAVMVASFMAFFFTSHQHRKYRSHLAQHARQVANRLKQ